MELKVVYKRHPTQLTLDILQCDDSKGMLTLDKVYSVESLEEHKWHTNYILEGYLDFQFIKYSFDPVEGQEDQTDTPVEQSQV